MPDPEMARVKSDLAAIKQAAGITDAPRPDELVASYLVSMSGACAALWAVLPHGASQLWGLLAALVPVGYLVYLRVKHGVAQGGSPQFRQEFADSSRTLLLAIPFSAYAWWAMAMGVHPKLVLATAVFFVGVVMLGGVLSTLRNLEVLPYSGALMLAALAIPATTLSPIVVLGLVLSAAGVSGSAIIRSRLKSARADVFAN